MSDFNMSYAEMQDTATKFRNGKDAIDTVLDELQQNTDDLTSDGFVTQVSSDAYNGNVQDVTNELKSAGEAIEAMADVLDQMVEATESHDEGMAGQ